MESKFRLVMLKTQIKWWWVGSGWMASMVLLFSFLISVAESCFSGSGVRLGCVWLTLFSFNFMIIKEIIWGRWSFLDKAGSLEKEAFVGLRRWLSSYEHYLLLRSWVQFLASTGLLTIISLSCFEWTNVLFLPLGALHTFGKHENHNTHINVIK